MEQRKWLKIARATTVRDIHDKKQFETLLHSMRSTGTDRWDFPLRSEDTPLRLITQPALDTRNVVRRRGVCSYAHSSDYTSAMCSQTHRVQQKMTIRLFVCTLTNLYDRFHRILDILANFNFEDIYTIYLLKIEV